MKASVSEKNTGLLVRWFEDVGMHDVGSVGGKNASLGEMIQHLESQGIQVPGGFATTAEAYRRFVRENGLEEQIGSILESWRQGATALDAAGRKIRRLFVRSEFSEELSSAIVGSYHKLCERYGHEEIDVAVRSSATAEDLPDASFAGRQETFLNIRGEHELLDACRLCYASLFSDRAIVYREHNHFDQLEVALSIGVQKMVRSDLAGSGVIFTIDTETGFPDTIVVTAAWGLGENVVQGTVAPDEYHVFKPGLKDPALCPIIKKEVGAKEKKLIYAGGKHTTRNVDCTPRERKSFVLDDGAVLTLARWALKIEEHYGCPMDIEWALDGNDGALFIVQARPETVQSRKSSGLFVNYRLLEHGEPLVQGLAIGDKVASGKAQIIRSAKDIARFEEGSILVTETTDPDWVPAMKKAAGIITEHGGRTSHAAIISRELGVPAIVGAEHAGDLIPDGQEITISCAEGERGSVYGGRVKFEIVEMDVGKLPQTKTQIKLNVASPSAAFRWWRLPCTGVGLARMEFIINSVIKCHPMALVKYDELNDPEARRAIDALTAGFENRTDFFVHTLARGIAQIAASQFPHPVIVRMSDFKTNEYANLVGGKQFEPAEENPMIGFRGASRYYSEAYREGFALECEAIRRVREFIGLSNVWIMIPFCRTLEEADRVLQELDRHGLRRGEKGLDVYVMCEIPSNIILAEEFAERFDGFSIGSNDLTQLTLGVDRDSAELAYLFDERNDAIKRSIRVLIERAHKHGRHVGICGQAPSDYPEFAEFLVEAGIDSISLNPDRVIETIPIVAAAEARMK